MAEESVRVRRQPLPPMPRELLSLFEWSELSKYLTPEELEDVPGRPTTADLPQPAEGA